MQRRSKYIQAGATLIIWAAVVCAANACKAPDDTAPTTTKSGNVGGGSGGGGPPPGKVDDAAGFNLQLTGSSFQKFVLHDSSDTTNWTTACKVDSTATGNATNIFCTVEAPEYDLYWRGLHMNFNVPSTMCTYVWMSWYGFYGQPVADGETSITYWVDKTGTLGIDANGDGIVEDPGHVRNGPATVATLAQFYKGRLNCLWDTSPDKGQNCCTGTYTQTVFNWDPTKNAGAGGYGPAVVSTNLDWGGAPNNCLFGPQKDNSLGNDKDGIPEDTVAYTDGTGFNQNIDFAAPHDKGARSNVYLANYINPADHGVPGVPAAFFDPGVTHPTFNFSTSKPAAIPQPYYDFGCMDQAFEYKARIRVDVRDWNTYTEWSKKGAGNPDVTGFESPPYSGAANNDRWDWKDMETASPGFAWPGSEL